MNDKMKSIVPVIKDSIKKPVIILHYKDKDHRKIVYSVNNKMVKSIYKYNYELKNWFIM